jgi:hypothetical protein
LHKTNQQTKSLTPTYKNDRRITKPTACLPPAPIASYTCKPTGSLAFLNDLFDFVTSSLICEIQMGEISKLGWLMGLSFDTQQEEKFCFSPSHLVRDRRPRRRFIQWLSSGSQAAVTSNFHLVPTPRMCRDTSILPFTKFS